MEKKVALNNKIFIMQLDIKLIHSRKQFFEEKKKILKL